MILGEKKVEKGRLQRPGRFDAREKNCASQAICFLGQQFSSFLGGGPSLAAREGALTVRMKNKHTHNIEWYKYRENWLALFYG